MEFKYSQPSPYSCYTAINTQAVQQQEVFRQRGVGHPMGTQLAGKTLGIIGMGGVGKPPTADRRWLHNYWSDPVSLGF